MVHFECGILEANGSVWWAILEADCTISASHFVVNGSVSYGHLISWLVSIALTIFITSNYRGIKLSGPGNFQCWEKEIRCPHKIYWRKKTCFYYF